MCNIVHTCIKKYTVAVLYSCKFCTARVFLFLADHEAIQFTNILKIRRYLCADEAKGLLVPYVRTAVRRVSRPARHPGVWQRARGNKFYPGLPADHAQPPALASAQQTRSNLSDRVC